MEYCIDSTNTSALYTRNYIRNKLLVEIRKNLNPRVDSALLSLSEIIEPEEIYLENTVQRVKKKVINITSGNKIELDLNLFGSYDLWLRRRLLRYCLARLSLNGQVPDRVVVDRLDKVGMLAGKTASLPEKIEAVNIGNKLVLYRKTRYPLNQELKPGQKYVLSFPRLNVHCHRPVHYDGSLERRKRSRQICLDYEKLHGPLTIRNIRPGDRFGPLGLKGTKKVGDYLTDRKIAEVYRNEILVICDKKGIVWLVGFEIADRVKIDSSTKKVIKIEVTTRRKD